MHGQRVDAIDTAKVFGSYAVLAGVAGFVLFAWGPMWLGTDLEALRFGKAALIRVLGAAFMATGCFAACVRTADPRARRRGLLWFAVGHAVVLLVVLSQRMAVWGPGSADLAVVWLTTALLVFLYFWQTAEGEAVRPSGLMSLFWRDEDEPSTERLRSQYEQQIRQAAIQEERNRLARDLHDSVKQQLFVIQTAAATAQVRSGEDAAGTEEAMVQVRSSAQEAMTELEVMLDQLQAAPLENAGMVEALKKQCEALRFRTGAALDLQVGKLPPSEVLPPGSQQAVVRVAQEALANVGRHARARKVLVAIQDEGSKVRLRIQDDGTGWDAETAAPGMGIENMRARATEVGGELEIRQATGGGTYVSLVIPYSAPRPGNYATRLVSWGILMAAMIFFSVRTASPLQVAIAVFATIVFARSLHTYLRVRRQAEALR